MLPRLIWESARRRPGRTLLVVLAVTVGASLATALLAVSLDITGRMAKELRAFGANIQVVPRGAGLPVEVAGMRYTAPAATGYLDESDLPKLKTIFWRNNIVGFAPSLSGPVEAKGQPVLLVGTWFDKQVAVPTAERTIVLPGGEIRTVEPESATFTTGMQTIAPWWEVEGDWVGEEEAGRGALVGTDVAARLGLEPGDALTVGYRGEPYPLRVTGVVTTGGFEDEQVFVDLSVAQRVFGLPGKVERVLVSALVKPDDELARRAKRNPEALSEEDFVTWYCSPYIDAITYQIEEVVGGSQARPVRQVAEAEGGFLERMALTLALVTVAALAAASLAVSATVTTSVAERVGEIGLMKAIGAANPQIALQFMLEAAACGSMGGLLGYGLGSALARLIGLRVFQTAVSPDGIVLPLALGLGVGIGLLGSLPPVRRAMRVDPVITLRGE